MMISMGYVQFIYLFANAFRVLALNLYMEVLFSKENLRISVRGKNGILAGYFVLNSMIYLTIHNSLVTILSNIALFFILTVPYKGSIGRRLFGVFAMLALGVVCEGIVGRTAMGYIADMEKVMVITYILSNFLFYFIALLLKKMLGEKKDILFSGRYWAILVVIPVISAVADVVLVLGGYQAWVNVTVISALFLINIVFFYLYSQMIMKCEIEVQNQALEQQVKAYSQQVEVIRDAENRISRLRHDYKNHLIGINELIAEDKKEEVLKYFEKMEEIVPDGKKYISTGNILLDGLINYKLGTIYELGAAVEVNINIPKNLEIDSFDGVVIVGNLMDNAINALREQPDGSFMMDLNYDKGMLFLHMKNSYVNELRQIRGSFLSTKKGREAVHGIGLSNVQLTVEKYHGEMEIKTKDNIFDVEIMLYI